jgi:tetratricopeptide (TPR) repeat protein
MLFAPDVRADAVSEEAERLFVEARALMDRGENDKACALLEESYELEEADGTLVNLAICEAERGKLAKAIELYETVLVRAQRQKNQDRIDLARDQLTLLRLKASRVTVRPSERLRKAGLRILLDGREIPAADWDSEQLVDGGDHEVVAIAGGKEILRQSFSIAPARETHEIVVNEPPAAPERRLTSAALGLLGASAVLGVVSTGLGIASIALDESIDGCNYETGRCLTEEKLTDSQTAQEAALGLAWGATIGLPLGAVGTLVGLLLPHEDAPSAPRPEIAFLPGGLVTGCSFRF